MGPLVHLARLVVLHLDLDFILQVRLTVDVDGARVNLADVHVLQEYLFRHKLGNLVGLRDVLPDVLHFLLKHLLLLTIFQLLLILLFLLLHGLFLPFLFLLHLLHESGMLNFRLLKLGDVPHSRLFQLSLCLFLRLLNSFLSLQLLLLLYIRLRGQFSLEVAFQLLLVGQKLILNFLKLFLLLQFLLFELFLLLFKFSSDLLALSFLLSLAHVKQLLCFLALLFRDPIKLLLTLGLLCRLDDHQCLLPVHLVVVLLDFIFRVVFAD